jgi:hypothetical protein
MTKQPNPLLVAMREAGVNMKCERVFTDALKDGRFRVKMQGRRTYNTVEVVTKLGTNWKNVTVKQLKVVRDAAAGPVKPEFSVVVYAERQSDHVC